MWATREDKAQTLLLCVTGYLEKKHTFLLDLHYPMSCRPVQTRPGLICGALLPPPTLPNARECEGGAVKKDINNQRADSLEIYSDN